MLFAHQKPYCFRAASLIVLGMSTQGCGGGDPAPIQPSSCEVALSLTTVNAGAPSYREWRDKEARLNSDGKWVFEGDIVYRDEDDLRAIYLQRYGAPAADDTRFRSIVTCDRSRDSTWNVADKLDLTYCFGTFSSETLREDVRSAMKSAAVNWELAADVNFIEVEMSEGECNCIYGADDGCGSFSSRAKIRVRQRDSGDCDGISCLDDPASAEFPTNATHEITFHTSANDTNEKMYRLANHEMGHLLGFAHEHYRFDQGSGESCTSAVPWRAVTDPDGGSVMGYGSCAGTDPILISNQYLSTRDRQGAAYLYNLPRNEFPSYTSEDVDDILWFIPREERYMLWRAQANPQGAITFPAKTTFCADADADMECDANQRRTRPIPVSLTAERLTDIIAYGPGADADVVLTHSMSDALVASIAVIARPAYDLPLVGRFFGPDALEEVWWVRPGVDSDPLGVFTGTYSVDETGDFGAGTASDGYYRPIVGLWAERGSKKPNSQVLWYREGDSRLLLAYQSEDSTAMLEDVVTPACHFGLLQDSTALRGDFDGDNMMELFWVSHSPPGQHVLWRDTFAMFDPSTLEACAPEIASTMGSGGTKAKPIVGDFDGDGSDDIFWDGLPSAQDEIWLDVGNMLGPTIVPSLLDDLPQSFLGDATAVVGDYNGDLCDDILWFSPSTDWVDFDFDPTEVGVTEIPVPGSHPLWRSKCNDGSFEGFVSDVITGVPIGAYPVGLDPRSAGRRADLVFP